MVGRKYKLLALSICVFVLLAGQTVAAQNINPGVTVSPAQINLTINKSDAQQTVPLTITNTYDVPLSLSAEFQGIDESAGLLIPTNDLDKSFAANLHISQTDIQVAAKSSVTVDVQITNTASLAPGGHYATLVLTEQSSAKQSAYKASMSLSLFVVKTDGAVQKLELQNITYNGGLFKLPSAAVLSFANEGNVHVVPRGVVDVYDESNNILSKGIVNDASLPLLPGKSLSSKVTLISLKNTWMPQEITLSTTFRPDGAINTQTATRKFLYIPTFYPVILLLLISGIIILYKFLRSSKHSELKNITHKYTIIRPSLHWDNPLKDKATQSIKISVKEADEQISFDEPRIVLSPKPKPKAKRPRTKKTAPRSTAKTKKSTNVKAKAKSTRTNRLNKTRKTKAQS